MIRTATIVLMGALLVSLLVLSSPVVNAQSNTFVFAAVGDYGVNNASAAAVASMVNGWNPELIVTLGDNYHLSTGGIGSEIYDLSAGKYYCNFLKDIQTTGSFCPVGLAARNRFFPTLGDHDYTDAGTASDGLPGTYTDYFTLPGVGYTSTSNNERYYDFIHGPVHFFILNGLEQPGFEPDGTTSTSVQAQWLKTQMGASTSTWNVVIVHKPPYSSGTKHGGAEHMQWPFAQWGADVVFSGHEHNYERILRDGIVYFVNGMGGDWVYPFGTPIEGSAARYNANNGAQRIIANSTSMTIEFYSIENGGTLIDSYTITTPHLTATPTLPILETGWQSPAWQAASRSNGDGNGYDVNPGQAFLDDGLMAIDMDSGTGPLIDCSDSGKDKHRFLDYNVPVPDGSLVQGIQVRLDANADSVDGSPQLCVSLSWNGGLTWSPWKISSILTESEQPYLLGGLADTWGRSWISSELSNANFQVRVADIASDNTRDFYLDWIAVNILYSLAPVTSTSTASDTPTASPTDTSTATDTPSATTTMSPTVTPSPSSTATPTSSATSTDTPTSTSSATATETPTPTSTWTVTPPREAEINIQVGKLNQRTYLLEPSESLRESYPGLNTGPVKAMSLHSKQFIVAERVIYKVAGKQTSFTEMMGLPSSQLDKIYWLPWYNNVDLDTQLRIANVSGMMASVHVSIGGAELEGSPFPLAPGVSLRKSFPRVNGGPVKVESNVDLIVAERVIYKVNGINTSFSEMIALPDNQLDTTYWLPWYNNVDLDTQLRIANVSAAAATVHIFIGQNEVTPSEGIVMQVGESQRLSFSGANNGPVKVVSEGGVPIVVAERVIYKVAGKQTSFTEMMGMPNSQLDTIYWLPWYNNVDLDTQLRFANVSNAEATVHIFIGGVERGTGFILQPGESTRQSFAGVNGGPVKIVSDHDIVAAERVIYKVSNIATSFSEMMALPHNELDTSYWLPWYNNVDLDTQLRFGLP